MSGFQFQRIEVNQFQQFREPVVIEGLEAGLNVIAGENEAGKSTLLRAIRAALFDRYRSSVGEHYRPHGDAVSPSVKLDFTVAGLEYHLEKTFSKKKDGGLLLQASNGKRWEGPEAEDYLAELLGFAYPGKGASRPEFQGLAGLLWVEQGSAHHPVVLNDDSREQVQGVFEQEVRDLLGGDRGEALFRRIQELRERYFDKRGNPRGNYRTLQQRTVGLAGALQEAHGELDDYEQQVDQLGRVEQKLREYREEHLVEQAEQKLREQQEVVQRIEALRARIAEGETKVAQAELALERAQRDRDARQRDIEAVEKAKEGLETVATELKSLEAQLAPLEKKRDELQGAVEELKARRGALEADLRRARDAQELQRIEQLRKMLAQRLDKARQLDEQRRKALADQAALRVTDKDLSELEAMQRELDLGEERLRAVATRVAYALDTGIEVRLADETISGSGEQLLTREATLEIEGVGHICITPGGEDLQSLQDQLDGQREQFQHRLRELGVETLSEANQQVRQREALEQAAQQAKAELKGIAPDGGLPDLQDQVEALAVQIDALREKLGEGAGDEFDSVAIEEEVKAIRGQLEIREADLNGYRDRVTGLQARIDAARANRKEAERHLEAAAEALATARQQQADKTLEEAVHKAAQTLAQHQRELDAAEAALAAENPEAVEAGLERAERVLQDLKKERYELEQEAVKLGAALDALGQQGLAEQVSDLETEYAQVHRELEQEDRQARALDLLVRTLDASLQQAREAVAQPIVDRIVGYLRQLMPGAEPVVDEALGLAGVRRNGNLESFDTLSIGTREQFAVLVRLAYADLLSEAGVPVTVILDDALVNSDDERRDRMKAILYQAAKRYQVLVLTCHGREYRDTGGTFIRLEERVERLE